MRKWSSLIVIVLTFLQLRSISEERLLDNPRSLPRFLLSLSFTFAVDPDADNVHQISFSSTCLNWNDLK